MNQAVTDWIIATVEYERDRVCRCLCGNCGRPVGRNYYCDLALDEFSRQNGQSVIPAFCEPVVDHDILPNDEARVLKRLEKWRCGVGLLS